MYNILVEQQLQAPKGAEKRTKMIKTIKTVWENRATNGNDTIFINERKWEDETTDFAVGLLLSEGIIASETRSFNTFEEAQKYIYSVQEKFSTKYETDFNND